MIHHIAADGWSMAPLARDLTAAYEARRDGRAPDWPALPIQYADYTLWQQELLGGEDDPESLISEQVEYWRKALAGLPEGAAAAGGPAAPRHARQPGRATSRSGSARSCTGSCPNWRRGSDASLYMVVQAGLAALLSRLGAGTDIPLGSPIAGRTEEGLDELVGFFVNTLVMRPRHRRRPLVPRAHRPVPADGAGGVREPGAAGSSGWSTSSARTGPSAGTRCSR
ncbi:hypothetical protein GCM10017687_36720 [Streptomyces echinatus]